MSKSGENTTQDPANELDKQVLPAKPVHPIKHMSRLMVGIGFALVFLGLVGSLLIRLDSDNKRTAEPVSALGGTDSEFTPTTIVVVGDIACDPTDPEAGGANPARCQDAAVAELVKDINPDKVMLLGDIQYETGTLTAFKSAFATNWRQFRPKFLPVVGNHEYGTPRAKGYFDYFNRTNYNGPAGPRDKGYYTLKYDGWSLYGLNSNCPNTDDCSPSSDQIEWLKTRLVRDDNTCQLAFWHHPLFTSGNYANSPSQTRRLASAWRVLMKYDAEMVLSGHDHLYERFKRQDVNGSKNINGLVQYVVGTGGKILYPITERQPNSVYANANHYGVLKLVLKKDSYSWKFITTDRVTLDQGTANCR